MGIKVFELAKELDMGAVDLVEKLRGLDLSVRNHMVSLSEEEAELARSKFGAAPKVEKKATKKKVTKKKVAKKKVTKKSAAVGEVKVEEATAASVAEESAPKKTKKKVVTIKKKARKKKVAGSAETSSVLGSSSPDSSSPGSSSGVEAATSTSADSTTGLVDPVTLTPAPKVSLQPQTETDTSPSSEATSASAGEQEVESTEVADKSYYEGDRPKGLQVVKNAEKKPEPVEEPAPNVAKTGAPEKKIDRLEKEKVHRFTPVYIPENKPKSESPRGTETDSRFRTPGTTEDSDKGGLAGKSKKRLGDLAANLNKRGGDKAKDLNMMRAEEELKFASGIVGRAVYSPAKRKKIYSGEGKKTKITEIKDSKRVVVIHGVISAKELSNKLSEKFNRFADKALEMNLLLKEDDQIGLKLAEKLSALYEYRVEDRAFDESKVLGTSESEDKAKESLPLRNPIITVMGHVDHGKTTLLDTIRKAKVASGEAGGITQHIGAYSVKVKDSTLTFLDTPGHAAFGAMRQRGANVTDIVVLVVAADDGVMPQTRESVQFIKNAGAPVIVAVNKMDKEDANPDRIKQGLTELEITPEDWGGDTQFVSVSALKGDGIDDLLEAIQLQAEMMELRAEPKGKAEGVVIESKLETGRGPVCTVIVQSGTLKKGDALVVGETFGRARSLMDSQGNNLQKAGPSTPVQILGLAEVPEPGDILNVVKNEREAKKVAENRIDEQKALENVGPKKLSLEDFFATEATEGEKKILNLIIRSDVLGSYEAIRNSLESLGNSEVGVKVIGGGAGAITDNDVKTASSTQGYIIGFNMRPVTSARRLSEQLGVDVKTYTIIYELIDDIKLALEGMLEPEKIEKYIGRAQVKETFNVPKVGTIAGSSVIDGKIEKGCNIRLLRDGKIVFDGLLSSLKRFKDDVKEVKNGYECGVGLEGYNDVKVDDIFEAYIMESKKRTLDDAPQVHQ